MKREKLLKGLFVVAIAGVGLWGLGVVWAARPGACECAPIDAMVKCSNGSTYLNACVASCAHATNCVRVPLMKSESPINSEIAE